MKSIKLKEILLLFVAVVFVSFSITSCKNKGAEKAAQLTDETIKQEIEQYAYPINSVFEVTNMLNAIEASYIVGIANDKANIEKYFSEKSKAINLGVYTADLAYATTYNQKADVQNYFKATETLVNDLSLTAAFNADLANQIEGNIDNKEKLVEIVTSMFQDAYSFLNKQGRTELSYLILAGTVFEGLYLTTHVSENTFQNPKLIEVILFQKEPLVKLEKMMEVYKDSEVTKSILEQVKSINAVYAMEEGTNSMTQQQIEKLTTLLDQIREANIQ